MEERRGEADLLAHARRVVDDELVLGAREIEDVQQLGGPLVDLGAGQSTQPAGVGEEFTPGEAFEEPQPLRQDADAGLHLDRVPPHVVPDDLHRALVGAEQSGDHRQGGGLPGPVRPDQPDEPPGGQFQIDPGDGGLGPEPLPEPLDTNSCSTTHTGRPFG